MILGTTLERIKQAARAMVKHLQHDSRAGSRSPDEEPLVLAVTNCYPIRIVLYAAAFQGRWKVHFVESLGQMLEALETRHFPRPKAVIYDHAAGDAAWRQYCAFLSGSGVPFVLLAQQKSDEMFLDVLAAGGYQAWGYPLTSEEIVKAVDLAGEVADFARVPLIQG